MAAPIILLLFFMVVGALGHKFEMPDVLLNAESPLDQPSAKFLKTLLENGLILNTPEVCHSLGYFCLPDGHDISPELEVPKRSLGRKNLDASPIASSESDSHLGVTSQPYGVTRWFETQPYGVSRWFETQPYGVSRWFERQPYGVTKWFARQPSGVSALVTKEPVESLPKGRAFRFASLQSGKSILLPSIVALVSNKLVHPLLRDVMPFNRESLPQVLTTFNLPADSEMAWAMQLALEMGENCDNDMEVKKSTLSTDEMLDFVGGLLCEGSSDCHLNSISQSFENKDPKMVNIVDVQSISKDAVACHTVPFPYKVYVCHMIKDSPIYKVTMLEDGNSSTTPVTCHRDTSKFRPDHQAFKDLNMKPGDGEICHWMPYETVVWYA